MAVKLVKLFKWQRNYMQLNNILKRFSNTDTNPQYEENGNNNIKNMLSVVDREIFNDVYLQPETIQKYNRGSTELNYLESVIESMQTSVTDIPIVIDGKSQSSRQNKDQVIPHKKSHRLARFFYATDQQLFKAIDTAKNAQKSWDNVPMSKRIEIWEKAAELLSSKYRTELVAATILGQSKVVVEAEQDAGADLVDILRMNAQFSKMLTQWQPITPNSVHGVNHLILRGLEGFVAAICSFNSLAYAVNLVLTPVLMGNSVLWNPHHNTVLGSYIVFKAMLEAGLPENVISFVPSDETLFTQTITHSEFLSGINYNGDAITFKKLWKLVAKYLEYYSNFPRLCGDCGGKNFHFVHESADANKVVDCTIRAAFEFSGQKSTSCTRLYVPKTMWEEQLKYQFIEKLNELKIGDATNIDCFTSAVSDMNSFSRLMYILETTQRNPKFRLVAGGQYSGTKGYFVHPTILQCSDLYDRIFKDEYSGPLLIVYAYKENDIKRVMDNIANLSIFALAGSVFAKDELFLKSAVEHFKNCAGNLFLNDKTTRIGFGQQPIGGTRMSGTNDKAGSPYYLLRWTNLQTIRENFYTD